jgi:4-amino-4-deoxy-L-arabinose transferase-like glycosyltransferase
MWDGAVFLLNAQNWLNNSDLFQVYRPPLISWIMSGIWFLTGQNWVTTKYVQTIFTIASIFLLYFLLKRKKGALFALGVSALTLSNSQLFFYTAQIRTEGISLFFLILTLYFFEGTKRTHWVMSGISIGLSFAARYPILLQSLVIFAVESILKKDLMSTIKSIIAISLVILAVIFVVYVKTGTFQLALDKDSDFGNTLSSYYLVNSIQIWGPAIILLPVAFLFRSTFKDKFNYIFIAWFMISFLSWSTNSSNHQFRFMIQFMPAAYFLVMLTIENLVRYDGNNFIFVRSKQLQ